METTTPTVQYPRLLADMGIIDFGGYRHTVELDRWSAAMTAMQAELQHVEKDKTASITPRKEGARSFQYSYADLGSGMDVARDPLSKHGLSVVQIPICEQGRVRMVTRITHASDKGAQWFEMSGTSMPYDLSDPKQFGIVCTYLRRYSYFPFVGLATEDKDAPQAARQQSQQRSNTRPPAQGWRRDDEPQDNYGPPTMQDPHPQDDSGAPPAPAPVTPPTTAPRTTFPLEFQPIAASMRDKASIVETFDNLRARLEERYGSESGCDLYEQLLQTHGVPIDFSGTKGSALKQLAYDLWQRAEGINDAA